MISRSELTAFAAGVVLLTLGTVLYSRFKPAPAPPGIHMPATPAPEIKREETEPLRIEFVKAFRPATKKKLKLPARAQADPAQHVVASTRTPADERAHTVTTLVNSTTGEFTTYDRAEPLPWAAVNTKTEIGLFYGMKGGEQVMRLQGVQEVLQVKAVRIGATATLDSDGKTFIGIGAWARW